MRMDELARRHGWRVSRMGPVASYAKGSISIVATGVSRVTRAQMFVGTAPGEQINPENVPHILRGLR